MRAAGRLGTRGAGLSEGTPSQDTDVVTAVASAAICGGGAR